MPFMLEHKTMNIFNRNIFFSNNNIQLSPLQYCPKNFRKMQEYLTYYNMHNKREHLYGNLYIKKMINTKCLQLNEKDDVQTRQLHKCSENRDFITS